jgi:hypothetical protein
MIEHRGTVRWVVPLAWSLVVLAFIGMVIIAGVLNPEWDIPTNGRIGGPVFVVLWLLVVITLLAIGLSVIIALVRWSDRPYWGRIMLCLPWLLSSLLFAVDWVYGQRVFNRWEEYGSFKLQGTQLQDLVECSEQDYERVKTGKFYMPGWVVERTDSTQLMGEPDGERASNMIYWKSQCAYDALNGSEVVASFQIIRISDEWYDCVTCAREVCHLNRLHFSPRE